MTKSILMLVAVKHVKGKGKIIVGNIKHVKFMLE
jgi:hypothetical protein